MSVDGLVDTVTGESLRIDPSVKVNDYQMLDTDSHVTVDATSNPVTITSPVNPVKGRQYSVGVINSTFAVELDLNGDSYFDDATNQVLFKGDRIDLFYDGVQYT